MNKGLILAGAALTMLLTGCVTGGNGDAPGINSDCGQLQGGCSCTKTVSVTSCKGLNRCKGVETCNTCDSYDTCGTGATTTTTHVSKTKVKKHHNDNRGRN